MGSRTSTHTSGFLVTLCALLTAGHAGVMLDCHQPENDNTTMYDYSLMDVHNETRTNLSDYQGKTVLIVVVATYCEMTPHYYGMNALNSQYGGQGFVVLGFPCNNFNKQEPGANGTEILNGVKYVRPGGGFVPNFQLFEKIDVNGANEHKLFTYLKRHCPPTTTTFDHSLLFYSPIKAGDVSWNWETFLVGKHGRVIKRAVPNTDPASLAADIEAELSRV